MKVVADKVYKEKRFLIIIDVVSGAQIFIRHGVHLYACVVEFLKP